MSSFKPSPPSWGSHCDPAAAGSAVSLALLLDEAGSRGTDAGTGVTAGGAAAASTDPVDDADAVDDEDEDEDEESTGCT